MPLVHSYARKVAKRAGLREIDDLIGEGSLALVQAAERWDPESGVHFGAFVRQRVYGAMIDYLRRVDVLTRIKRRARKELASVIEALTQDLQRFPTQDEVVEHSPVVSSAYQFQGKVLELTAETVTVTNGEVDESLELVRLMVQWTQVKWAQCAIAWHYLGGMNAVEISHHLAVPSDQVRECLDSAMHALRDEMDSSSSLHRYEERTPSVVRRLRTGSVLSVSPER